MRITKVILIILYIPFGLLILITLLGLIHRWSNPGYKSISGTDLKQIGTLILINVILIVFVYIIRQIIKQYMRYHD
jgi:hypothetical protein